MIQPKKAVIKMKEYSPPTAGRENKLRLDFNENTIGCSPKVISALKNIDPNKLSTYPEYGKFTKKLSQFLEVDEEEVCLTNATDEAIKLVFDTFIEKGDEVIIPIPTFAMFKFYASLAEAQITEILYNDDLSFPFQRVLNTISEKTKIVVLVNPNNPTGTSIPKEQIISILEKADKNNCLVLVDEAYFEFFGKTSIPLIKEFNNLVVLRSFSKAIGLAGLRLGCIITNSELNKSIKKACSPYSVNCLAIIAGETALDDYQFVKNYATEILENKPFVIQELKKLNIKTFESDANFVLADFGEKCDFVAEELKEKEILVRNRTKDPLLKGCLRITIGTKAQCEKFLNTLTEILKKG